MAVVFDQEKVFEIPTNGLGYFDSTGNLKLIIAAGDLDPIGTPAPIHSRYYRTNGEIWRKTGPADADWQNDIGISSVFAKLFEMNFFVGGNAQDKFLESPVGKKSSEVPQVLPYSAALKSVVMMNKTAGADIDLEIYRVPFGSGIGTLPRTPILVLQPRDFRIYYKNNLNVAFNSGDKIMIFSKKIQDKPQDLLVSLYFQVTNDIEYDRKENFTGKIEL